MTVDVVSFELSGQPFMAISAGPLFKFNEAISFMVYCDNQEEIDYYWDRFSAGGDPEAQQCGWLKDKFGLSWQVVPTEMDEMVRYGTPEQIARVTQAFLKMKKFDLAELRRGQGRPEPSDCRPDLNVTVVAQWPRSQDVEARTI